MVDKIECNSTECNSVECNSVESNSVECDRASSINNQQFTLKKINEIKDYFIAEIKERELMSKRFSKYIDSFVYFDKFSIVLSATSGSVSIASFATVIGTLVGIASLNLSFTFSLSIGFVKNY